MARRAKSVTLPDGYHEVLEESISVRKALAAHALPTAACHCDPLCEKDTSCAEDVGLAVGVPVYDEHSEEVFGVVMIVCDMNQLLR